MKKYVLIIVLFLNAMPVYADIINPYIMIQCVPELNVMFIVVVL